MRWLARTLLVLLIGTAVAAGILYGASEWRLRRHYDVAETNFAASSGADAAREGERLGRIHGCVHGCHGQRIEGGKFFDDPWVGTCIAPNLVRLAQRYSDADFERAIRHGVRSDRTGLSCMPSSMFYDLSDADLGAIVAFVRSEPEQPGPDERVTWGPLARWLMLTGDRDYQLEPEKFDGRRPRRPAASPDDPAVQGSYIAHTSCTECHGLDLKGGTMTPNLAIVKAYSEAQFRTLVSTGVPRDGRELHLMKIVALGRFKYLNDTEVGALYAYLSTLAAAPETAPAKP